MNAAPTRPEEFFQNREFAVVLEGLRQDFKVFGEDLKSVKSKVDATFERVGRQEERLFVIETDIRFIKIDIAEIKLSIKDHGSRLTKLEKTPK